jgi:hypothetical protein
MYTYIKKNHSTHFVEFDEPLSAELYNNLGTTWEDYENNDWVLLTPEQVEFYKEHPDASVEDVFNMQLTPEPSITLDRAKLEKIIEIEEYDGSDNVNVFDIIIGNQTISTWITRETRADYKNSLDAAELLGQTEVTPVFNGQAITIPLNTAKLALAQIQLYANRCYNVTEQHKVAINAMDNIEDIEAFDITAGYP